MAEPPEYLPPCAITSARRPGPSASWLLLGQGSQTEEPRWWASELLQTLECARASLLKPPHSQQQGRALKAPGMREREALWVSRVASQGSRRAGGREGGAWLKLQETGDGQGPGTKWEVGETAGQGE